MKNKYGTNELYYVDRLLTYEEKEQLMQEEILEHDEFVRKFFRSIK